MTAISALFSKLRSHTPFLNKNCIHSQKEFAMTKYNIDETGTEFSDFGFESVYLRALF